MLCSLQAVDLIVVQVFLNKSMTVEKSFIKVEDYRYVERYEQIQPHAGVIE